MLISPDKTSSTKDPSVLPGAVVRGLIFLEAFFYRRGLRRDDASSLPDVPGDSERPSEVAGTWTHGSGNSRYCTDTLLKRLATVLNYYKKEYQK